MCRFNEIFAKLQFPQRIACHARAGALCSYLWDLSDGILYVQRTMVKNLTKTMEIIIDFFFICKNCDIMI